MARETQPTLVDRAIFACVAIFLLVLALVLILTVLGWQGVGNLVLIGRALGERPIETVVGAVVLVLAALHVLLYALQHESEDGIRQETEIGHVRISMRAIENLVYRTARNVRGIRDVDVIVHPSPEGVAINLSLVVVPETHIPRISEEVGHLVRNHVRETVGIDVGDIAIEIRNIVDESRARVE